MSETPSTTPGDRRNTEADPYAAPQPAATTDASAPERLWPGWLSWLVLVGCLTMIVLLRFARQVFQAEVVDTAVVNLLTYLFTMIAGFTLWMWFCWFSTHPLPVRRWLFRGGLVAGLFVFTCVRINGFSGDMVPTGVRFSWQKSADFAREKPKIGVPLVKTLADVTVGEEDPKKKSSSDEVPLETSDEDRETLASMKQASRLSDPITPGENDFPQFLGPSRTGHIPGVSLATDWQTKPPHEVWRTPVGAGWSAFSVVGDRAVTLEQFGDEEWITCRRIDSGELLWHHIEKTRHENVMGGIGPRATPTIDQLRVYSVGATGIVVCLNLQDGKLLWRHELQKEYYPSNPNPQQDAEVAVMWGRAGSPLVYKGLCIVPAGGRPGKARSLVAFDCESGEKKWDAGSTQISYASPVVLELLGREQIVSVNETDVTGHDPADGTVLWSYPWPGNSAQAANCSQPHRLADDLVFISKGYGVGAAVFKLTPDDSVDATFKTQATTVWANRKVLKTKFTNVVMHNGYAYGLNDGVLECVDTKTGTSQWKKGRFGNGQLLGVGNRLLVLAEKSGEVALVAAEPDAYRELSRFIALGTGSNAWNNLCLTGNKLLVRNADEAACFELP